MFGLEFAHNAEIAPKIDAIAHVMSNFRKISALSFSEVIVRFCQGLTFR